MNGSLRDKTYCVWLLPALLLTAGDILAAEIARESNEVAMLVGIPVALQVVPESINLTEPRDSQQMLVTGRYADGTQRDLTRLSQWEVVNPALLHITPGGRATSCGDGTTQCEVRVGELTVRVPVTIRNSGMSQPISFRQEVMPVLSAAGCADIRCHGAPSGKNGFRLSLWGHDPELDIEQLTRDVLGRRTNSLDPANSLILLKALTRIPHVGGRRFDNNSTFAKVIHEWQAQGVNNDPHVAELRWLRVTPSRRVLHAPGRWQQLSVRAEYTDGRSLDVTHLTTFNSTDMAVADVDGTGLVEFHRQGEVAILCRFCGQMESVRLMYISAPPVDFRWPEPPENNYVDHHVFAKLRMLNIAPSDLCTDEEFIRRIFLDVCGVLPTVAESRNFAANTEPDKRARLADQLLQRTEYADFWTKKWMDVLRTSRDAIQLAGASTYHGWLHGQIENDIPFDQVVRQLLTSRGESYKDAAVNFYCVPRMPKKITDPFYLQKDLAEATAQLFLGIRLQCAQCHNHPYERWTQDDYLSLAAFFTQVKRSRIGKAGPSGRPDRRQMAVVLDFDAAEITHESSGEAVIPGFPGEPSPEFDPRKDRRPVLASWLTHRENPFFAKTLANRTWFHLFGRGIVQPVDDFRDSNPSANDALLDALADELVTSGFQLKSLIRTIVNSRTYQLSSAPNPSNQDDERYFSHLLARPLSAEVLLDAITSVTGIPEQFEITEDYIEGVPAGSVKLPLGTRAVELPVNDVVTLINTEGKYVRYELHPFLRVFGQPNGTETCECAREQHFGRKQALELLVGRTTADSVARPDNMLRELMQGSRSDAERLDELYQCGLSRSPSPGDAQKFLAHIADSADQREAWEDILWTVLNSQEFIFQH